MIIEAGQVAVITGAGSGIGAALAHACAARGMHVVAADIELNAALRTVRELKTRPVEAIAVEVDVARRDAVLALAEKTRETFGKCHLLCNNAGVSVNRPLSACTADDWDWVWSVNVLGIAHALEAFLPMLKRQTEDSHIVNTASMAGLIPLAGFGAYVASKYAVVGLSEVLQQELAGSRVGVSILCPGIVDTRIFDSERNRQTRKTTLEPGSSEETADTDPAEAMHTDFDEAFTRMISPDEVAATTLGAIESEQLYVATHPEWISLIQRRSSAIHSAFVEPLPSIQPPAMK